MTTTGLLEITGMFPLASKAAPTATHGGSIGAGYIAIPVNSLSYTGVAGQAWTTNADGTLGINVDGGVGAGPAVDQDYDNPLANPGVTGSFQNFIRAIHETAYNYTANTLTGTNATKYWGEAQGNYSIYDQTALTRKYSTDLYYVLDDSQGGKASSEV